MIRTIAASGVAEVSMWLLSKASLASFITNSPFFPCFARLSAVVIVLVKLAEASFSSALVRTAVAAAGKVTLT